ncbi:pseudouridylate synthase PUS7L isoform X3 [Alligator mississippiensis]|uniref:pseudouridylate synthase PUS7L isoform X3 n=1 Tax=Alligator mississippiensis TaxID=8496 RepID=UPI0028775BC0|nr:pseudouridylate synthase PUS7L isoform X3 [Alligator mississippiensis]
MRTGHKRFEVETSTGIMLNSFSYVNDHIGFCGSVKNSPSDFVVTEIDVFGQLLSDTESSCAISETPLEQKSPYQQHHKRLRINTPELGTEDEHCQVDNLSHASEECLSSVKENKERVTKTIPKCGIDDTDVLDSLLSKSVNELLSQFACNVKDAWNSENDQTPYSNEFSLGPIFEKENRACLHSAIRQKFPFLMTVTKNSEIIVKANADYRELCQFVTEEEAYDFFKFLDAKLKTSKFSFKPDENKEHRKTVHHFISKKFGKLLETKSFSVTDFSGQQNTAIMVRFREKTCSRKRPAADCQEKQNLYTAFTLQKENLETLEAIGYLSSELGVLPSDFSYTGIKDKKAITYQAMVVKKVTPERMKEVGTAIVKKGMKVYNIHRVCQHLRLGQLKGNHFDITVRDLGLQQNDSSADVKERISEAIENIQTNGFVNYYGPQRFGQGQNVRTDQIGLALLNEEMVKAVKLFFTPEDTDDPVNQAKKYFLQTEDAKGTLARMPEFKVHIVTAPEESASNYTIHQVVLPMVGHSIKYPSNKVGQWYHEILAEDALQTCRFRLSALQLNIPGCYRHILKNVHNLSYRFLEDSKEGIKSEDSCHLDASKASLFLSFDLDPSCYATVCLREIMKCDI